MACSFTIPFSGAAGLLVNNIQSKILSGNGQFNGDDTAGNFSIQAIGASIEGSYRINGNDLLVTIANKPFFVSCGMIEGYVRDNLTGNV